MIIRSALLGFASLLGLASAAHPTSGDAKTDSDHPLPPILVPEHGMIPADGRLKEKTFTLRHIYHHGAQKYPRLHRYVDISPNDELEVVSAFDSYSQPAPQSLRVKVGSTSIQRLADRKPADIDRLIEYYNIHGTAASLSASSWTIDEMIGPNITDKETIISLAKMAANAYTQKYGAPDWLPVGGGFNYTDDFGWEADGLRGHVFVDEKNHTVVIGLKGTSPAVWDGADTTGNDKLNDNLFGSCCCGQGGPYTWKVVCDCKTSTYTCNSTCLVRSLRQKGHYYWAVRDLYHNVTERYPTSDVWLSGHSLGGVVSSLLGLTYGLPTVTFEAFPDALAASRLGLPTPPGYRIGAHQSRGGTGVYHIGHTADPIYMGTCNGQGSFCSLAGYAFQGTCHTGSRCAYDTVNDLGWRPAIGTHKIVNVIRDVLEKYDTVPECDQDVDCQDCFDWKFYESNGTETTTSTTTTKSTKTATRTRTVTCKTPGWFGCLDETTTTTNSKTSTPSTTTSSTSSSTCKTPGWFGCKDPPETSEATLITITTTTTVDVSTTSTPSATCETPGWFGCKDSPEATARPSSTHVTTTAIRTSPAQTSTETRNPSSSPQKCQHRNWLGRCRDSFDLRKYDL